MKHCTYYVLHMVQLHYCKKKRAGKRKANPSLRSVYMKYTGSFGVAQLQNAFLLSSAESNDICTNKLLADDILPIPIYKCNTPTHKYG